MYFTRNSNSSKRHLRFGETNNLRIFSADFRRGSWTNICEMPFNGDTYSVGHPALSPDNNTMYFVSDMPGGYGNTDIYKSVYINGKWSNPVNLGATVNTRGREMFPFVGKDGLLYFSSDGYPGIGGLDIYVAEEVSPGKYKVINLPSPINSSYDDFGFTLNNDSLKGYLTSDRVGGKGEDDIYSFRIKYLKLKVFVYDDKSKNLLPGSHVTLTDEKGQVLNSGQIGNDGFVCFSVNPATKYQLSAQKTSYIPGTKNIETSRSVCDLSLTENIYIKQEQPVLTVQAVDSETGGIVANSIVDMTKGCYQETDITAQGGGEMKIKIDPLSEYEFTAKAKGYFENSAGFSAAGKKSGEYQLIIKLEKITAGKQFTLENLYYDLNKYNIRPDAAAVLDRLVKILNDNPQIRIEVGSHTDSRATAAYNQRLSQLRSESVVASCQ